MKSIVNISVVFFFLLLSFHLFLNLCTSNSETNDINHQSPSSLDGIKPNLTHFLNSLKVDSISVDSTCDKAYIKGRKQFFTDQFLNDIFQMAVSLNFFYSESRKLPDEYFSYTALFLLEFDSTSIDTALNVIQRYPKNYFTMKVRNQFVTFNKGNTIAILIKESRPLNSLYPLLKQRLSEIMELIPQNYDAKLLNNF